MQHAVRVVCIADGFTVPGWDVVLIFRYLGVS